MKVWAWTSNFGFGRISLIWGDKLLMIFWKEISSTLQGRAWFHSSNHITLVNYLDSMGSLWRYICSQELVRMRGIKSMQVYSWKRMECTSGLARFIEFNFSDQHAICLNSRKREFEGSVTQTFVCRGRRGMWFGGGLAEPEVQSSLPESHPSCSLVHCAIWICATCWGRSRTVVVELDSSPPHLFLYLFYSSKSGNKQGLYRFRTPGSLHFI